MLIKSSSVSCDQSVFLALVTAGAQCSHLISSLNYNFDCVRHSPLSPASCHTLSSLFSLDHGVDVTGPHCVAVGVSRQLRQGSQVEMFAA